MCLSVVYVDKHDPGNAVVEEASQIFSDGGAVVINTLFGRQKSMPGYAVAEINLMEHYVVLRKQGAAAHG